MSFSLNSSSVLVAGGAGYIGSHTAKALARAGIEPVVLDNFCTGNPSAVRFGSSYEGSIADYELLKKIVTRHRPMGAILFAGHAYVGESTANPRKYFQNNVVESIDFLNNWLDADGERRLVFSSSCSVYGIPSHIPISESSVCNPLSPYAETKAFFEKVLKWYGSAYGLRSACLRYFNAAGADPDGELGERHDPETHLIPLAIAAALGKGKLRVFGTDYPTPDGTAIRDFIHVADLADGHVRALRHLAAGGESFTLNLGTGKGFSVREVIREVENTAGVSVPLEYEARREGDAPELVADPQKASRLLGWTPQHSSLKTIVQTAWDWHRQQDSTKPLNGQDD
jgi:UDP-arabinose 4-epimerase